MKKLYCITSHCNTKEKIESLKRTIKQLNDLNRDILNLLITLYMIEVILFYTTQKE